MKYCPNCGSEIQDDAVFCPNCGRSVSSAPAQTQAQPAEGNGIAIAGFVLSLCGVGILGLIFGIIGLNKAKRLGGKNRGFAIAAIIISIVSMVFGLIYTIVLIAAAGTTAAYSSFYFLPALI